MYSHIKHRGQRLQHSSFRNSESIPKSFPLPGIEYSTPESAASNNIITNYFMFNIMNKSVVCLKVIGIAQNMNALCIEYDSELFCIYTSQCRGAIYMYISCFFVT